MRRVVRSGVLYVALAAPLLSIQVLNAKQPSKDMPAAPLPAQIGAAKRVFISYAAGVGGNVLEDDRVYDQFYAALKSWGRYELLAAPADADLVLEVSVSLVVSDHSGYPRLRLAILDPKTQVVLWAFTERVDVHGGLHPYVDFDGAITKILDDVKKLDGRAKVSVENAQK